MLLYKMPIGKDFSLVTVLAGVDRASLDVLQGAGFSDKLSKPNTLAITVRDFGGNEGKMTYTMGDERSTHSSKIKRRWNYNYLI